MTPQYPPASDKEWKDWGYKSYGQPCDVCGSTENTQMEPSRFNYVSCQECANIPPAYRYLVKIERNR